MIKIEKDKIIIVKDGITFNISNESKGDRDIIWCHTLNRPAIIEFETKQVSNVEGTIFETIFFPKCPCCYKVDELAVLYNNGKYEYSENFLLTHTFICNIKKK